MRLKAVILLFLLPLAAWSASLRMEGDRVWLDGGGASLVKVLRLFEECGVEVLIDPSLELDRVTGSWENARMERVIAQLAGPNTYLLEWKRIKGPLGDFDQLDTIRIFSDGSRSSVERLSKDRKVLDVVEGAGGIKYIRGEIMVGFAEGATEKDLNALLAKLSGTVIEVINPPGVYRIRIGEGLTVEEAIAIALAQDKVDGAEPNRAFSRIDSASIPLTGTIDGINLHLQSGETAVAVLDSGLDPQYADLPFIRGTYNAVDPSDSIYDPSGHGTLTSLIASGALTPEGADAATSGVPVLSIMAFDENGMTSSDIIYRALDYASNSDVSIVSMSWGSDIDSSFLETAMNYAASLGVTLYASAGNEPTGTLIYPAGYESVIAVGGLNPDGSVWENSNYGDFVQIWEPAIANFNGQTYAGTSISSPYAAFLAALKAAAATN
ncbi:MAG: S8 family serine peptidase [Pontiellaceae bacterium]|nr:S8 family serine peptidase [Pontiellaceae bacterium]MBN2785240.1 S8 family serine peptidase [Pontiellaceae bacterium]